MLKKPAYKIRHLKPANTEDILKPENWIEIPSVPLEYILPESSDHHPKTEVSLFTDQLAVYGRFTVNDRYVRCINTGNQAKVSRDSCVEFFLKPAGADGYFNFEFNCGGSILAYYIRNPERVNGKRIDYDILSDPELSELQIRTTMPSEISEEIKDSVRWELAFRIPFRLISKYSGIPSPESGIVWTGNFYKCADHTSHPHWLSWAEVPEKNFHIPEAFGNLIFD